MLITELFCQIGDVLHICKAITEGIGQTLVLGHNFKGDFDIVIVWLVLMIYKENYGWVLALVILLFG
jgi:hypothetical protein